MSEREVMDKTPTDAGVLEYQRAETARKAAIGGLVLMGAGLMGAGLMGLGLMGLAGFVLAVSMIHEVNHRRADLVLVQIGIFGPVILWGGGYVFLALMSKRGKRWAGMVALVMTSIKLLALGVVVAVAINSQLRGEDYMPWYFRVLVDGLLAAVSVGFGAVVVEVWRAVKEPRVWGV